MIKNYYSSAISVIYFSWLNVKDNKCIMLKLYINDCVWLKIITSHSDAHHYSNHSVQDNLPLVKMNILPASHIIRISMKHSAPLLWTRIMYFYGGTLQNLLASSSMTLGPPPTKKNVYWNYCIQAHHESFTKIFKSMNFSHTSHETFGNSFNQSFAVGKKLPWFIRHLSDGLYLFFINLWNFPWDIWA